MDITTEQLEDSTVKITVTTEDGRVAYGWVSSFHLVETKVNQLKESLNV
jgi:hypothetical protein